MHPSERHGPGQNHLVRKATLNKGSCTFWNRNVPCGHNRDPRQVQLPLAAGLIPRPTNRAGLMVFGIAEVLRNHRRASAFG